MKVNKTIAVSKLFLFLAIFSLETFSQQRSTEIQVTTSPLSGPVHRITARSMNMVVSVGDDGILLIDHFHMAADKIAEKLRGFGNRPVKLLINTHQHRDHIAGNPLFRNKALIIAHSNLKKSVVKTYTDPAPYLPHIEVNESMSIFFNGEEIRLFHLPDGHTESDLVVYFTKSKVLSIGDLYLRFERYAKVH